MLNWDGVTVPNRNHPRARGRPANAHGIITNKPAFGVVSSWRRDRRYRYGRHPGRRSHIEPVSYPHANADPHTDSYPHADADPHANSHPHADADPHADSYPHANADPHTDSYPHANADPHADSYPHADADPHSNSYPHADADPHANSHPHANADPHTDAGSDYRGANPGTELRPQRRYHLWGGRQGERCAGSDVKQWHRRSVQRGGRQQRQSLRGKRRHDTAEPHRLRGRCDRNGGTTGHD